MRIYNKEMKKEETTTISAPRQPSIKQRRLLNLMIKAIESQKLEDTTMYQLMINAGYKPSMARNPYRVFKTKSWQMLLAEIDDRPLLYRLLELAMNRKNDKVALDALKEVFKLKDRYPEKKILMGALKEREEVIEDIEG